MATVIYGGRVFRPVELPTWAALHVSALSTTDQDEQLDAMLGIIEAAGISWDAWADASFEADETPLEMVGAVLEAWSSRPWRTTVMLSHIAVTQWSSVRGRLIQKGIPDPMRQIPSMNALLDAVEGMLMETAAAKGEDEVKNLERALYPPPAPGEKPSGEWSDEALLADFPEL